MFAIGRHSGLTQTTNFLSKNMVAIVSGNSLGLNLTSMATLGQQGALGSAAQGRNSELAYVNIATGNFVLRHQDEYLASRGLDGSVVRTYNSLGKFNDDNGDNWSIGIYNQPLQLSGTLNTVGSSITRTASDGSQAVYRFDSTSGHYVSTDGGGAYNTIVYDGVANQYVWTEGSTGVQEHYEGDGSARLLSRTDVNGNTSTYAYNGNLLTSVTDASGETTYYDYVGNNLSQIRVVTQDGATTTRVHYSYDTSNRLSSVTVDLSPTDNSTTDGKTYVTNYTYDGASDRIASVSQTDGSSLTITYINMPDGSYRVATITDGLNHTTSYSYDLAMSQTTVTDPLGVASVYTYDSHGQLTQLRSGVTTGNSKGLSQLQYRYNDQGDVLAVTDGLGQTINYQYDAHGNQTLKVDALGNTVVSTYTPQNQLLTQTIVGSTGTTSGANLSLTSRNVFDAGGKNRLRFTISPQGRVTEYRYDSAGLRTSSISYAAASFDTSGLNSSGVPSEAQMQAWATGQDQSQTQRTDLVYDFRGQMARSTTYGAVDATGAGLQGTATQYIYSQTGELLQTMQPNVASTSNYVYDGLHRVIASSTPSSDGVTPNTTTTQYNDAGGSTTITLANGLSTLSTFDAAGRLISVVQSSSLSSNLGTTKYAYDADNRLLMTTDPTGVRRWMLYDAAGRKVADIDGTGALTEYVYNGNGQLTQTIGYATPVDISTLVDANGLPKAASTINPLTLASVRPQSTANDHKSWNVYDSGERLVWQIDTQGYVTQTDYDSASRVVAVTSLATPVNTALLGDGTGMVANGAALGSGTTSSVVGLSLSQATTIQGGAVTLTAVVLGNNPSGTVTFYSGTTILGSVALNNGVAQFSTNSLPAGVNNLSVHYSGDAGNVASVSVVKTEKVLPTASVSLASSAANVVQGETLTLTATVAGSNPSGSVSFFNGDTLLGSAIVQNGQAAFSVASLPVGSNNVLAVYSGDPENAGGTSAVVACTIAAAPPATTVATVSSSQTQAMFGSPVTFSATIAAADGAPVPTGTVTFTNGATVLGTATLVNGVATFTTSALPLGEANVQAVYSGDAISASSTSASTGVTVATKPASFTSLSASPSSVTQGSSVLLFTQIGGSNLSGKVTFLSGNTVLGSASVFNGIAALTCGNSGPGQSLPVGDNVIVASYSGDATNAACISTQVVNVVVTAASAPPPVVTLRSSAPYAYPNASVTLIAALRAGTKQGLTPTGGVTFYSGGTLLGTATLNDGLASLSVNSLPVGINNITVTYAGDANNRAVTSAALVQTIAPPASSVSLTASDTSITQGADLTLSATVNGASPSGLVTFYSGNTVLGTATVTNGVAVLTTALLRTVGTASISASYSGDAANATSKSIATTVDVTAAATLPPAAPLPPATAIYLTSSASSAGASQAVTFSVTVTGGTSGIGPSGSVSFFNGTTLLGTAQVISSLTTNRPPVLYGNATFTVTDLPLGSNSITAVYSGDANAATSTSAAVTETIGQTRPTVLMGATVLSRSAGSVVMNFTAKITGASPTGQVTFCRSGASIGNATIDADGVATLSNVTVVGGDYSSIFQAGYFGDANNALNFSNGIYLDVRGTGDISLQAPTPANPTVGSPVTLTAAMGSTSATGTVSFFAGNTLLGSANLINGVASLNTAALPVGNNSITAVYSGSPITVTATSTAVTAIVIATTTTTISANQTQTRANSPVTLSATIATASGAPMPTGTVTFSNGATVLGTASLINGVATFTTCALPVGTDNVQAVYAGDTNSASSTSATSVVTVSAAAVTSVTSLSTNGASNVTQGSLVNLTAQIGGSNLSGKVTFFSGNTVLGIASVLNGFATLSCGYSMSGQSLPVGNNVIFASYSGDATNAGCISTQSVNVTVTASPAIPTTITLSSSAPYAYPNTSVTLFANVRAGNLKTGTTPTGSVTFYNGSTVLGTATLSDGLAKLSVNNLPVGANNITVAYAGDANNSAVTSAAMVQTIAPPASSVSFTASATSITQGADLTLSATISGASPCGLVTFYNGSTVLGTATVTNGVAVLTTAWLRTVGTASIRASYSGDAANATSQSTVTTVDVTAAATLPAEAPLPAATIVTLGSSASSAGVSQAVTFSAFITGGTNGIMPSGSVSFFNGTTLLGTAQVVISLTPSRPPVLSSIATFTVTDLPLGSNAITAVYSGDANAATSTSSVWQKTIVLNTPTVSLGTTVLSRSAGSVVMSLTAQITGASPTGQVTFYRNGSAIGNATFNAAGIATLSNVVVAAGGVSGGFQAGYFGDANNALSFSQYVVVDTRGTDSITLQAPTPANPTLGFPVTLTANTGTAASTGVVSFFAGSTLLGSANLVNGVASLGTTALPVGNNSVTAVYSGSTTTVAATSAAVTATVTVAATTSTISSSQTQARVGSPVAFTATITTVSGAPMPTGSVTFTNGSTVLGTGTLVNGIATFTTSALPVGAANVQAVYAGDASNTASTSANFVVAVQSDPIATSSSLTVSSAKTAYGSPLILTATVSGPGGPSGQVTFKNGNTVLGAADVVNGKALLTLDVLPSGPYTIVASYTGDAGNAASSSTCVTALIVPLSTQMTLASAASVLSSGSIKIQVSGLNPGGVVTLLNGQTVLGAAQVVNGVASFSANTLPVGSSTLTASYSGDASGAPVSISFSQTVVAQPASTQTTLSSAISHNGQNALLTLTAAVVGKNPSGSITFYNDGVALGTAPLTYGFATLTLSSLPVGLDVLTATYSGDASNATSTSAPLAQATTTLTALNLNYSSQDRAIQQVFDQDGLLRATIDGEGYLTEYRYNAADQQTGSIRYANRVPNYNGPVSIAAQLASARQSGQLGALLPTGTANDIQTTNLYNARGQLAGEVDAQGYLTEMVFDANGNVTQTLRYATAINPVNLTAGATVASVRPAASVQDQVSRTQWDALNRIAQTTNAEGTVTQYSYDSVGNLTSTVVALNSTDQRTLLHRYDLQGRVTAELSAEGAALLTGNQTQAQVDAIWSQYAFTHSYDAAGRRTSSTDQNGNKTLFYYDANGQLTDTINALGEVSEQHYDALGQRDASTVYGTRLASGVLAGMSGGLVNGTVQSAINTLLSAGGNSTTRYTYNSTGHLSQHTDALGNTVTMGYNAFGEVVSTTQALSGATSVVSTTTYDRRGLQTTTVADAGGLNATEQTQYDAFGRVKAFFDANGNTTSYDYQDQGRTLVVTAPQTIAGLSATQRRTTYDAFNRVLTQTEDVGRRNLTTSYAYDQTARSVGVTTPEGITVVTRRTRQGQTLSVTDGNHNTTTYDYDKNGNLSATNAPLSHSSQTYDRASRLVETVDANGHAVHITYDAANRVISRAVDPNGLNLVTHYSYGAKGEQLSVTDPLGNVTTFSYNLKGELETQTVDPTGLNLVTRFEYDGRGKTVKMTDAVGNVTVYSYDKLGRRTSEVQDPTGLSIVKNYSYDANGNVVKVEIPLDNSAQYAYAYNHVTRYAYDADNRLRFTLEESTDGITGQSKTSVSENIYNSAGRLVETIQYASTLSTDSLTALGDAPTDGAIHALVSGANLFNTATDHIQYHRYDKDGHLTGTAVGRGDGTANATSYGYDNNGNVIKTTAFANPLSLANLDIDTLALPVADPARDKTVRTVYDAQNRAIYVADGTLAPTALRYDAVGNLTERIVYAHQLGSAGNAGLPTITDDLTIGEIEQHLAAIADAQKDQRTSYVYDAANRVSHSSNSAGQAFQYLYDANGNVLQTTQFANGLGNYQASGEDHVSRKVYDAANRLTRSVDPTGAVTDFAYDKTGNVLRATQYAQAISGYVNAVGGSSLVAASTPLANWANDRITRYGYDSAGRQAVVVDAEGEVTHYEHNALGLVTNQTQYANKVSGSVLSALAAGTPVTANGIGTGMVASPQDRVTRQRYDAAGQLEFVVDAEGYVTRYRHDGIGQMVEQTRFSERFSTGLQATFFDASARSVTTNAVTDSGYDAAGQLVLRTDALGNKQAFSFDGAGNKTSFTNEKGSTWNYDYDAAGHLIRETSPEVQVVIAEGGDASDLSIDPDKPMPAVRLVTALTYDARGNVLSRTEAAGLAGQERTTKYTYDSLDRQISTTFAAVGVYSENPSQLLANSGHVTRQEATLQALTTTTYDVLGNAYVGTDAAGNISTKTYDKAGRVEQETDAAGNTTTYQRNTAFGDVSSVIRRAAGGGQSRQIDTYYDRMGRAVTVQNESVSGVITDSAGNATAYQGVRPTTQKTYNAFGELIVQSEARDPIGQTTLKTYFQYDKLGRQVGQIDAAGYLTAQSFDARGNVLTHTEFAKALTGWAGSLPNATLDDLVQFGFVPDATNDHSTEYQYDLLNRKTQQTEVNLRHSTVNNDGSLGSTATGVSTKYEYDNVGNLTKTIDQQSGAVTQSVYDSLGRITVVKAPKRNVLSSGATVETTPVTEFHRDAFGSVTILVQRASDQVGNYNATDRATYTRYDALGRAVQTTDALGNSSFMSYDALGREAKQWQNVASAGQTVFTVNAYDLVGNRTHIYTVVGDPTPVLVDTAFTYNAFGEVLTKTVLQNGQAMGNALAGSRQYEYYDYDAAGRVWRTNAGDGVTRIFQYDLQGNQTIRVESNGLLNLENATNNIPQFLTNAQTDYRRTDMVYDALGHLVLTKEPSRAANTQQTVRIQGNDLYASISKSSTEAGGTNQVDMLWSSLGTLGSGDVRITLSYDTQGYQSGSLGPMTQSKTVVLGPEETLSGYSLKWTNVDTTASGSTRGISHINSIKLEKKDIFGNWATVYDNNTPANTETIGTWTSGPLNAYLITSPEVAPQGIGVIPLYRYINQFTGRTIAAADRGEPQDAINKDSLHNHLVGWSAGDIIGYIAKDYHAGLGLVGLFRFQKNGTDEFRLISAPNEANARSQAATAGADWSLVRLEGFVQSATSSVSTQLQELQTGAGNTLNWRYTTSDIEAKKLLQAGTVLYHQSASLSLEVSMPTNLNFIPTLEVRNIASGAVITIPDTNRKAFQDGYRYSALGLAAGNYEYTLRTTNTTDGQAVLSTGVFSIGGSGNAVDYLSPNTTGKFGQELVGGQMRTTISWDKPTADIHTLISYKLSGQADIPANWHTEIQPVAMDANGRVGVVLDAIGAGSYDFKVETFNWVNGEHTLNRGTVTVTASAVPTFSDATVISTSAAPFTSLGVAGYLYTDPAWNRVPLKRYSDAYGHHYFTARAAEPIYNLLVEWGKLDAWGPYIQSKGLDLSYSLDNVLRMALGFSGEGIAGYANAQPSGNDIPLYSLYRGDPISAERRFTTSFSEVNQYLGQGWEYDVVGYVDRNPDTGTQALYRLDRFGVDQILTFNGSERAALLGLNTSAATPTVAAGTPAINGVSFGTGTIDGRTYGVVLGPVLPADTRLQVIIARTDTGAIVATNPEVFTTASGRAVLGAGYGSCVPIAGIYPPGEYTVQLIAYSPIPFGEFRTTLRITVPANYGSGPSISVSETPTQIWQPIRVQVNATPEQDQRPTTSRQVDRWGNVTRLDGPQVLGNSAQPGGVHDTVQFSYNAHNQLVSQTQTIHTVLPNGVNDTSTVADMLATTAYAYDAQGNQIAVTDARGKINTQRYDAAGNLIQEHHADGGNIQNDYDAFAEKVRTVAVKEAGVSTVTTAYAYDNMGHLLSTTLQDAVKTYQLDSLGLIDNTKIHADNNETDIHNANGVIWSDLNPGMGPTVLETSVYDEAGRKVASKNANGEVTRYGYDRSGQVSKRSLSLNRLGAADELTLTPAVGDVPSQTIRISYDALGRTISQTDATGAAQNWNYDQFGRRATTANAAAYKDGVVSYSYTYSLAGALVSEQSNDPRDAGNKVSKDYKYDQAGQLITLRDNYLGQTTQYTYDLAGNRLTEKLSQLTRLADGTLSSVVYQDNNMVYDTARRLVMAGDGRATMSISYDEAGNRKIVTTTVRNGSTTPGITTGAIDEGIKTTTSRYDFDAMGRQIWQEDAQEGNHVQTRTYSYDKLGNRTWEKNTDTQVTANNSDISYAYDSLGHLTQANSNTANVYDQAQYYYDGAGRVVASITRLPYLGDTSRPSYMYRYNQYNATGHLLQTRAVQRGTVSAENQALATVLQRSDIDYHGDGAAGLGYDGAGNLLGYVDITVGANDQGTPTSSSTTTVKNTINVQNGQAHITHVATHRDAWASGQAVTSEDVIADNTYDPNGYLVRHTEVDPAFNRTFVNNAQGQTLYVNQNAASSAGALYGAGLITNPVSGYVGGYIGNSADPGQVQRQLIVNGEALARYGIAPKVDANTDTGSAVTYQSTLDVSLGAQALNLKQSEPTSTTYTVQRGETLQSIARSVYGDGRLWYRLADANGLAVAPDAPLLDGQTLTLPKLSLSANNANSFSPYDPSKVVGNTSPNLPDLPMPAQAGGGGCGGMGQIIMMVVAIVATIYTAGAASAYFAGAAQAGFGATMTAGMSALGGTAVAGATTGGLMSAGAAAIAGAAVGGAVGSIASQAVGNLIGAQQGFSWTAVAMGAIGAAAGAGIGGGTSPATWQAAAGRAALGNALTQGVAVVTGLQDHFDWTSVAASVVGAGVGSSVSGQFGTGFGGRLATGLIAGTATALARGGKVSIQQVAVDAFGNALGSAFVDNMRSPNQSAAETARLGRMNGQDAPWTGSGLSLSAEQASQWGPQFSSVDPQMSVDYSLGSGQLGTTIGSDSGADFRTENLARMMRLANEPAALGSDPFRVEVSGLPTPDEYNAAQVQRASEKGWDLRPTAANAANLELMAMDGSLSGAELAGRFGQGLLGAVKSMTVEPLLQVRDLGLAGASVAYNELFRSNGDAMWLPEMKSGMADAYANGASQTRLLLQSNFVTGTGVLTHDLTTSAMNSDWGSVAEQLGGVAGGFAIGKGASKYGGYGLALEDIGATGPGASQMGAVKISLVTPNSAAGRLLVANNEGMFYPEVPDLRTGRPIQFPVGEFAKVDKGNRTTWDSSANRYAYIKEWNDRGYEAPVGGWKEYDIHHIQPLEYGGNNNFWNLVPVQRQTHVELLNKFWRGY